MFGYKNLIPSGILDEITLWHGVQFIDISQQIAYNKRSDVIVKNADHLRLCLVEYVFEEEGASSVIYIESGRVFKSELLDDYDADVKGDGYAIFTLKGGYKELLKQFRGLKHEESLVNSSTVTLSKVDDFKSSKWSCSIKVRNELVFSGLLQDREDNHRNGTNVALLIPSKNENSKVEECALVKYFIPSFLNHTNTANITVTLYVGYDTGDAIFSNQKNKDHVLDLLESVKVKFIELPRTGWLTFIWNYLFAEAFADGNDFFVQLNDDIRFLADGWLDSSVKMMGDSGVIGLNDSTWQCKLYTQTLVARSHYQLFSGQYFPLPLRNWYSDNWITEVYGSKGRCNEAAVISNGNVATRYAKCDDRNYNLVLNQGRLLIK